MLVAISNPIMIRAVQVTLPVPFTTILPTNNPMRIAGIKKDAVNQESHAFPCDASEQCNSKPVEQSERQVGLTILVSNRSSSSFASVAPVNWSSTIEERHSAAATA